MRKRTIVAWLVFVGLAFVCGLLYYREQKIYSIKKPGILDRIIRADQISRLEIRKTKEGVSVVLEKKADDWFIMPSHTLADKALVAQLTSQLEGMRSISVLSEKKDKQGEFYVDKSDTTRLVAWDGQGTLLLELAIGRPIGEGVSARLWNKDDIWSISGPSISLLSSEIENWREKSILPKEAKSISKLIIRSSDKMLDVRLEFPGQNQEKNAPSNGKWSVQDGSGLPSLVKGAQIDGIHEKVLLWLNHLQSAKLSEFVTEKNMSPIDSSSFARKIFEIEVHGAEKKWLHLEWYGCKKEGYCLVKDSVSNQQYWVSAQQALLLHRLPQDFLPHQTLIDPKDWLAIDVSLEKDKKYSLLFEKDAWVLADKSTVNNKQTDQWVTYLVGLLNKQDLPSLAKEEIDFLQGVKPSLEITVNTAKKGSLVIKGYNNVFGGVAVVSIGSDFYYVDNFFIHRLEVNPMTQQKV